MNQVSTFNNSHNDNELEISAVELDNPPKSCSNNQPNLCKPGLMKPKACFDELDLTPGI